MIARQKVRLHSWASVLPLNRFAFGNYFFSAQGETCQANRRTAAGGSRGGGHHYGGGRTGGQLLPAVLMRILS